MTNFFLVEQQSLSGVRSAPDTRQTYTLDDAARVAGVHPDLLRYYCRSGLLGDAWMQNEPEPVFDDDALYELRRIEHYRRHHGLNLRALPLVISLLREIEDLDAELRSLRNL